MARYRVQGPDGQIHVFEGPDNATPQEVEAFAAQTFGSLQRQANAPKAEEPSMLARAGQQVLNAAAGAVRGAGSIGATILAPVDAAARAMGVQNEFIGRTDRRQAMTGALDELGADTTSLAFGAGKLGAEIAGTLPVGGLVARGISAVPGVASRAPAFVEAVRTAGMTTGVPRAAGVGGFARDMGTRMAGGVVAGGSSAALVNPEDAGVGAAVGAAAPPVIAGAKAVGGVVGQAVQGVRDSFRGPQAKAGRDLARALDLQNPADVTQTIQALRQAGELVPGSRPTMAQALQTPQAGVLQRVVHDSPGGAAVAEALAAQNAARLGALEGVAPTMPSGAAQARQDVGEAVSRFAQNARQGARDATRQAYEAVPQDEAALYLPDLAAVRDKFFGPGVFTSREGVDKAVATAQQLGQVELPALKAATAGPAPRSLAQAVRRAGGLSQSVDDFRGEVASLGQELPNMVRRNGGETLQRMAQRMHQEGYIDAPDINVLVDALRAEARGSKQYSMLADSPERMWQAARDAAMGEPPGATTAAQKVTLRTFDDIRKSIGELQRAAARDPAKAREAAALSQMKSAMDARLNEVVAGDGAIDEVLPIAWADALDKARKLKLDEVERFLTGPQAALFRKGADGQPLVQGGEVMAKFWGNRPGLADDVDSFRRLIADNPDILGRFRSMVTTEGAATQDMAGKLGGKFVKWVDAMTPGLRKTFSPQDFDTLQRIAQDIRRAEQAAQAGMARGSPSYQNAANALDVGLLGSPGVRRVAGYVPWGQDVLQWAQESAVKGKAKRLADVVSDAQAAADALQLVGFRSPSAAQQMLANPALQSLFYRTPAVIAADR